MPQVRVSPEELGCTTCLSACAKPGEWGLALSLLGSASRTQVTVNVQHYTSAISACERAGEWEQALVLLRWMRSIQVTPNFTTHGTIGFARTDNGQRSQLAY